MTQPMALLDLQPASDDLLAAVLAGLDQEPKTLPCKLLYDRHGSQLFDRICELPEYYPTRTEMRIMRRHVPAMASALGRRCLVVELGSGSSTKTRRLLDALHDPAAYVPVDISREHLLAAAQRLKSEYPSLEVLPVCADYTQPMRLPTPSRDAQRRAVYFPGSTIGNFHPDQARRFLGRIAELVGHGGALLIGVDLRKDPSILVPAYDDATGVTAEFNLNVLRRLNRELDADFRIDQFRHEARWNDTASRIEMHLVAQTDQVIDIAGRMFTLGAGESIRTECSYKHTLEGFAKLAGDAFDVQNVWLDDARLFSVQYLVAR